MLFKKIDFIIIAFISIITIINIIIIIIIAIYSRSERKGSILEPFESPLLLLSVSHQEGRDLSIDSLVVGIDVVGVLGGHETLVHEVSIIRTESEVHELQVV